MMTDLEICKRIARIEYPLCTLEWCKDTLFVHDEIYNPLTDKALCFDLMVKYDVRVEPSDCNAWIDNEDGYPEFEIIHYEGTLQKAICLAIIEAHKG